MLQRRRLEFGVRTERGVDIVAGTAVYLANQLKQEDPSGIDRGASDRGSSAFAEM